jgi:hypothetical protein
VLIFMLLHIERDWFVCIAGGRLVHLVIGCMYLDWIVEEKCFPVHATVPCEPGPRETDFISLSAELGQELHLAPAQPGQTHRTGHQITAHCIPRTRLDHITLNNHAHNRMICLLMLKVSTICGHHIISILEPPLHLNS